MSMGPIGPGRVPSGVRAFQKSTDMETDHQPDFSYIGAIANALRMFKVSADIPGGRNQSRHSHRASWNRRKSTGKLSTILSQLHPLPELSVRPDPQGCGRSPRAITGGQF